MIIGFHPFYIFIKLFDRNHNIRQTTSSDNMKVKTIKLINNQHNLVHYHQYYEFETIGDIKKGLLKKYKNFLSELFPNQEAITIYFDKQNDDSKQLVNPQNNVSVNFQFKREKEDEKNIQNNQKNKNNQNKEINENKKNNENKINNNATNQKTEGRLIDSLAEYDLSDLK